MVRHGGILVAFAAGAAGVLRFPDAGYEMRWPMSLGDCDGAEERDARLSAMPTESYRACVEQLLEHLRDDSDCSRLTPDNSMYFAEAEHAAIQSACDQFRLAFECAFDLGLRAPADVNDLDVAFRRDWQDFVGELRLLFEGTGAHAPEDLFAFANTSVAIIRRHTSLVVRDVAAEYDLASWWSVLRMGFLIAVRLQFMIENLSMSALVNYLLQNLVQNGIADGRDYVGEKYGHVQGRYVFHDDLGPKRWNVLCYLLERMSGLGGGSGLRMAEIGVDTANVSRRLLERYPSSVLAQHVGVDPYANKPGSVAGDEAYEATRIQLAAFGFRSVLLRHTSLDAARALGEEGLAFDLVYIDAGHDHKSVLDDIQAWLPLVKPGGVLAGHDFQWQYPGLPMAVTSGVALLPAERAQSPINLARDGMWWFDL